MRLNDIYPTIQGEGAYSGTPMVVVRLQGCGVGCPFCDTKETWDNDPGHRVGSFGEAQGTSPVWTEQPPEEIARLARQTGPTINWALVTGGEPAEQDLEPLVRALHKERFLAALETSGTALGHAVALFDWVTVSPKFDMPGGKIVDKRAVAVADEIKQVVATQADIDRLSEFLSSVQLKPGVIVSLQPVSMQRKATFMCVDACIQRGWRLSLQLHKYIDAR